MREPFEVAARRRDRARACADGGRRAPALAGAPYWADAAFIAAAGIPTVMFGASGTGAHAVEEWVSVEDSVAVTRDADRGRAAPLRVRESPADRGPPYARPETEL